jgi:HK97 family phage major capsid protein/HK97 family phage prohead protease
VAESVRLAYSELHIKSVDTDQRLISGIASTPEVDRMGDIVEPSGATFAKEIPLLLHHDSRLPVGTVRLKKTSDGIQFEAALPRIDTPGTLRERVEEAWQSMRAGLLKFVSIGFRTLDDGIELMKSGGLRFTATEILELSLVAIPANASASITTIRSICAQHPAASGDGAGAKHVQTPGATGSVVSARKGAPQTMKTYSEQIQDFQAMRQAKDAERKGLMTKAAEEGVTLDAAGAEKYDELTSEIKNLDGHLARLRDLEESNKAAAVPVAGTTQAAASASRGGSNVISIKENRPAGIGFARVALAKTAARLESKTIGEVIADRWPTDDTLKAYFQRAAVPGGTTTSATWAGNLVDQTNLTSEFLEFLRPQTIIGRLPGVTRVPFNIRVTGQTTGSVAGWVGEGKGKPVTSFNTNAQTLLYTKIAAIAVITEELARFSSPSAEMLVRNELARAVVERMDIDFIDPAQAAVANVNPASITNGVTALTSAGTSADNIRTDIQNLLEQFILNNQNVANLAFIMPNTLALAASILRNSLGQPEFPELGVGGGSLMGVPVITSQYAANQSGYGNLVIAVDQSAIFLADDGQVTLDASREASIEMSDAPANNTGTPTTSSSMVSMYQTNSIAIRAERYINWLKARTTAVSFIDDANWGSIGSPS